MIIDGYPKASRDELAQAGMTPAWKLYANMLQKHLPGAEFEVLLLLSCLIVWAGLKLSKQDIRKVVQQ